MTSQNRVRTVLLAWCVTGCADASDGRPGTPGPEMGVGPLRPAAGGEDLVVEEQPLEAPVVLDPVPEGLVFRELWYDPPRDGDEPARATLYGDPDLADTLDGPVLLVGTSSGSATIAGPR